MFLPTCSADLFHQRWRTRGTCCKNRGEMAGVAQLRFAVEGGGEVSALLLRPAQARRLLVMAHGAGGGMSHPFMEQLADELAGVDVATFRYQFPYMETQRRVPDAPAVLMATFVA